MGDIGLGLQGEKDGVVPPPVVGSFLRNIDNVLLSDDFYYEGFSTPYEIFGTGVISTPVTATTNGVVGIETTDVAGELTGLSAGNSETGEVIPNRDIISQFAMTLDDPSLSIYLVGLFNTGGGGTQPDNGTAIATVEASIAEGMYFEFDPAVSANWVAVTVNGSTRTKNNTGVAASGYQKFEIKSNFSGSKIEFFIDGIKVATSTTNLPDSGSQLYLAVTVNPTTASSVFIDLDLWLLSYDRLSTD